MTKVTRKAPRIDRLALRPVRHGIADSQGIGRCGQRELDKILLTFEQHGGRTTAAIRNRSRSRTGL